MASGELATPTVTSDPGGLYLMALSRRLQSAWNSRSRSPRNWPSASPSCTAIAASNINRQLPAFLSTVGQPKAELMAARIRDINPACELNVIREFLIPETVADIVPADVDYVIDCIDSLNCKVALVASSVERGLRVASSMGAGNKLDPTRIKIADIAKTSMCPLAAVMRKRLRKRGIAKGVLTVFSDEAGRAPLPPQPVEGRGRDRAVNGTISYMPPLFGLMLAGAVVQRLIADA